MKLSNIKYDFFVSRKDTKHLMPDGKAVGNLWWLAEYTVGMMALGATVFTIWMLSYKDRNKPEVIIKTKLEREKDGDYDTYNFTH